MAGRIVEVVGVKVKVDEDHAEDGDSSKNIRGSGSLSGRPR
jgi:hypothetical protein